MSSSTNKKKVHYTSSTKGKSSHSHSHSKESKRSSRDSGVGSSSASDRASLGTTTDNHFDSQDLQYQRHNPSALSEALDAANERIRELEKDKEQLKSELRESSKERRALKDEKHDLLDEVESLGKELADERRAHDKLKREVGAKAITSNSGRERRTTPPHSHRPHNDRSSQSQSHSQSQSSGSYHDDSGRRPYVVPQPPPAPNPFTPLTERGSAQQPNVSYPPATTVTYSPVAYSTAPTFAARTAGSRASGGSHHNSSDGNYHSYPVE